MDGLPRLSDSGLWDLATHGICSSRTTATDLSNILISTVSEYGMSFAVDHDFGSGLSISRDGRWMIYSEVRDFSSDIMLVDHFE